MPQPFTLMLDILKQVKIKSIIVLKIKVYDCLLVIQLLLLVDIQQKLVTFSLGMCLDTLAISVTGRKSGYSLLLSLTVRYGHLRTVCKRHVTCKGYIRPSVSCCFSLLLLFFPQLQILVFQNYQQHWLRPAVGVLVLLID